MHVEGNFNWWTVRSFDSMPPLNGLWGGSPISRKGRQSASACIGTVFKIEMRW